MTRPTYDDLEKARLSVQGKPRPHDPNRVMKRQCATCPWRTDGQGLEIEPALMSELMTQPESNQYCHSPAWKGQPEDTICRGHRDHWKTMFHRMGVLSEPTDESWAAKLQQRSK